MPRWFSWISWSSGKLRRNKEILVGNGLCAVPSFLESMLVFSAGEMTVDSAEYGYYNKDVENIHITTDKISKRFESISSVEIKNDNYLE